MTICPGQISDEGTFDACYTFGRPTGTHAGEAACRAIQNGIRWSTLAWTQACLEEAWVIITEEDAQAVSLDVTNLLADINALRGTG